MNQQTIDKRSILMIGNYFLRARGNYAPTEELKAYMSRLGYTVYFAPRFGNRISRLVDMSWKIVKYRNRYQVAIIEVYSGKAFIWAEWICFLLRLFHKPFILNLQGGNLPKFSQNWPGRVKRLLQSADNVTAPSNYLQAAFVDTRNDIVLFPNAVDLNAYAFKQRSQPQPRLAWLRAFHSIYSPLTAAKALSLMVEAFPEIELTMFGPDKGDGSLQSMQAWAAQAGVKDQIKVAGAIPKAEVPTKLAPFDIFLNTTTAESFGVSVVEAAAMGMCIVTTNVGELPYIWTHEHDALLVPPNDPEAMANAIRRILTEPGLAERLSRNARAKAETFDWSIILPQWETLLSEVIEARG